MPKYFKTIVKIEILSCDVPVEFDNLRNLHRECTDGECCGEVKKVESIGVTPEEMASLLSGQNAGPDFFDRFDDDN